VGTKWNSADTIFFICSKTIKLKQSYAGVSLTFSARGHLVFTGGQNFLN